MSKKSEPISVDKSILIAKCIAMNEVLNFFDEFSLFKEKIKEIASEHNIDSQFLMDFTLEQLQTESQNE